MSDPNELFKFLYSKIKTNSDLLIKLSPSEIDLHKDGILSLVEQEEMSLLVPNRIDSGVYASTQLAVTLSDCYLDGFASIEAIDMLNEVEKGVSISMTDLAKRMGTNKAFAYATAKEMEKSGYVKVEHSNLGVTYLVKDTSYILDDF